MARIFYSMAGEGRGHATRARAIIEDLRREHEVTVFAPGDAHELLSRAYADTEVRVHPIPGLRFCYTPSGRVDYPRTLLAAAGYTARLSHLVAVLAGTLRARGADMVIADFEPALPRAARRVGVPVVSLDHQHFMIANRLPGVPWLLRLRMWIISWFVRRFVFGQATTVISSFYSLPPKRGWEHAVRTGVILRPEVVAAPRGRGGHLVAYFRKFAPRHVLDVLKTCGREVRVYGLGERPRDGDLVFRAIDERGFLADLGTAECLVSTAGNQVVGEALYLGKPVLAMPEPGNDEQRLNGHFLKASGEGDSLPMGELTPARLGTFLGSLDLYRARIQPSRHHGNPAALDAIRRTLARARVVHLTPRPAGGLLRRLTDAALDYTSRRSA